MKGALLWLEPFEENLDAVLVKCRRALPCCVSKTSAWKRIDKPKHLCGVYALIFVNEVVYIGQSTNMLSRLTSHCAPGKEAKLFNEVRILRVPRQHLDFVEAALILALTPKYNRRTTLPVEILSQLAAMGLLPIHENKPVRVVHIAAMSSEQNLQNCQRTVRGKLGPLEKPANP